MTHHIAKDIDPQETREWLAALANVQERDGEERIQFLLAELAKQAKIAVSTGVTPYINTISHEDQPTYPGNMLLERTIRNAIRWNAIAMVLLSLIHI